MIVNALQVGYKHVYIWVGDTGKKSFNSSQVGYKQRPRGSHHYTITLFQFLIGRLQTCIFLRNYFRYLRVSIPHRQATNIIIDDDYDIENCVSIPHRQATNVILSEDKFIKSAVSIPHRQATNFPEETSLLPLEEGFNSSQVGYKPLVVLQLAKRLDEFQFLIGRLQTEKLNWVIQKKNPVSIPHRQATNKEI